jgi:hypothetical protein
MLLNLADYRKLSVPLLQVRGVLGVWGNGGMVPCGQRGRLELWLSCGGEGGGGDCVCMG